MTLPLVGLPYFSAMLLDRSTNYMRQVGRQLMVQSFIAG